jgi:broad specificity phosphatase PhoE
MKIVIVRHAKVLIKNKKIYANELKKEIEEYDRTPIDTNIKNYHELVEVANSCNYFVSSGFSRSVNSLALLGKEADYIDKIFSEVESPYTDKKIIKLSLFTWGFWFKLAWYMGFSGGAKSYQESKIEAFKASKILINLAKEHGSVMLMGHGLKNRLIATALRQQGWIERKKMKIDNLDYGVFVLHKFK